MEHGIAQPDLSTSFADRAGSNISVQQQLDVTPSDPNNFSAQFNNVTLTVGQPDPSQPTVDLNNLSIQDQTTPLVDATVNAAVNLEAVKQNTPSLLGDVFEAGNSILNSAGEVNAYLSGPQQGNNGPSLAAETTASINGQNIENPITGFQNNFNTPGLA